MATEKDSLIAALTAATPNGTGGHMSRIEALCSDKQKAAILAAKARGVGYKTIAALLTKNGIPVAEGAVRTWVAKQTA